MTSHSSTAQEHWQRKRNILQQLSASEFISGEAIAQRCQITRAAVHKHIEALIDYGVGIYAVKGKGYKLEKPIYLADESRLKEALTTRCFYFDEIDSTNAFLLKQAPLLSSGDLCLAEYQQAGRGRLGRTWLSPYASHLYFSMVWQFKGALDQTMGLSSVVGCALIKVLQEFGVHDLGLKWPNDVYLQGRKLAGILIELSPQQQQGLSLVIGIGVNLAMSSAQGEQIDQPWSDIGMQLTEIDKTALIIRLQQQLCAELQEFTEHGLAPSLVTWQAFDLYKDKTVTIHVGGQQHEGIYRGMDRQGAITIDTGSGSQSFIGGEVSLRPQTRLS